MGLLIVPQCSLHHQFAWSATMDRPDPFAIVMTSSRCSFLGINKTWVSKQCLPRHSAPACCQYPCLMNIESGGMISLRASFFQNGLCSLRIEHKPVKIRTHVRNRNFCTGDNRKEVSDFIVRCLKSLCLIWASAANPDRKYHSPVSCSTSECVPWSCLSKRSSSHPIHTFRLRYEHELKYSPRRSPDTPSKVSWLRSNAPHSRPTVPCDPPLIPCWWSFRPAVLPPHLTCRTPSCKAQYRCDREHYLEIPSLRQADVRRTTVKS